MRTGLDLVTFPGMGPLKGKISWTRLQIAIFSYKTISNIFSPISQRLIFVEIFLSIR